MNFFGTSNNAYRLWLITAGLLAIAIGGYWIPQSGWAIPVLLVLWGGVVLFIISAGRRLSFQTADTLSTPLEQPVVDNRIIQIGFYLFLASFAIGWRQLWLTPRLAVHPSEAMIWTLFVLRLTQKKPLSESLSGTLKAFLALGLLGVFVAFIYQTAWDIILAEFRLFLVIIPVIHVTRAVVCNATQWRVSFLIIAIVTFYISLLGLIEYFAPEMVAPFSSFFADTNVIYSQPGFARADFTFWGGSIVNVFLAMMLVPIFGTATVERDSRWKLFLMITTVLCAVAVYVAGGRGSWLGAVGAVAIYVFLSPKLGWLKLVMFLVFFYYAVLYFVPSTAIDNIYAVSGAEGYYDSSALVRASRIRAGINLIKQNPYLGRGWGGSGWVHSDLIQIGANLGLLALFFFLYWYLSHIWRLYRLNSSIVWVWVYKRALIAGLAAALLSLSTQAIIVLPPLIIPLWFLVAVAERLLVLASSNAERNQAPLLL